MQKFSTPSTEKIKSGKPNSFIQPNLIDSNENNKYTDENILIYNGIIWSYICPAVCVIENIFHKEHRLEPWSFNTPC